MKKMRNRWQSARAVRLWDMVKMIPDDEFVIIFDDKADESGYQEKDAIFNGEVRDFWKDPAAEALRKTYVLGLQARELEDTVGPATMIVTF